MLWQARAGTSPFSANSADDTRKGNQLTYITGAVAAVPTANKAQYTAYAAASWPMFKSYGALRMVETWGVDVPKGKVTDFYGAVAAREDEGITFSWIEWPDKATADASWQKMGDDPAMKALPEMPFDGKRMVFGGFSPIYSAREQAGEQAGERIGSQTATGPGAGYYQGFLLAVPAKNKAPYVDMAGEGWKMFAKGGALSMIETWGEDVPRGEVTDFYRATKAEEGEVPVFSWAAWPDRATCDAAAKAMEADWGDMDTSQMPFDGMRMMWGGFEPLFDSEAPGHKGA